MIVTQDDDIGLIMPTVVRGHTIQIDPQLISVVIMVPVLLVPGVPFQKGVEASSIDYLLNFFEAQPQGEERAHPHIRIGAFVPMHRFLAKIVVPNFWPQARHSELTLKKARLMYAIVMRTPFFLCKHIMHTMLGVRDETNASLSFGCLITHICLQFVIDISNFEPKSRIPDSLEKQTLMKSNAQLRHEGQGEVPQSPPVRVDPSVAASSS
jgi:hypothetical protein